jgi:hypothetical protein
MIGILLAIRSAFEFMAELSRGFLADPMSRTHEYRVRRYDLALPAVRVAEDADNLWRSAQEAGCAMPTDASHTKHAVGQFGSQDAEPFSWIAVAGEILAKIWLVEINI